MEKLVLSAWVILATIGSAAQSPVKQPFADQRMQTSDQHGAFAAKDWLDSSQETREVRLQWWRQARFGIFLSWGGDGALFSPSPLKTSGPSTEGKAGAGMSERNVRARTMATLPAHFQASEWVQRARLAGAGYLVVSLRNRNGLLLYPSPDPEENAAQKTGPARDPIAELAASCRKTGLRFGICYPIDGKDGSSEMLGTVPNSADGRNASRRSAASADKVFEKQGSGSGSFVQDALIPQLTLLISRYHPDLLWLDGLGNLPASDQLGLLKTLRELDPELIVSGTWGTSEGMPYPDYRTILDGESFPQAKDWELALSTRSLLSWPDPADALLRQLAQAGSANGNLLLCLEASADGSMRSQDLQILRGLSARMPKLSPSLRGTAAAPLPRQQWGLATQNGKTLYLHVFHWPEHGKLYIGGLKSRIKSAALLRDPRRKFSVGLTPARDVFLRVPSKAPDAKHTILALELDGPLSIDTLAYFPPDLSVIRLFPESGTMVSQPAFALQKEPANPAANEWKFRTSEPRDYQVRIRFTNAEANDLPVLVQVDDQFRHTFIRAKAQKPKDLLDLGRMRLEQGRHQVRIQLPSGTAPLVSLVELVPLAPATPASAQKILSDAEGQVRILLSEARARKTADSLAIFPRTADSTGLRMVASADWTSGFFPGMLWLLYEASGNKEWKTAARQWTAALERETRNNRDHDIGFRIMCSYGNAWRLTRDAAGRSAIVEAARTLSTRFNEKTGVIRSWDFNGNNWCYPVIIDNMMNLELLFAATRLSGDSSFYRIALSHARTTMRNHYRYDYSSFHVVDYDTASGRVQSKVTAQGYANTSAWARGQSWGLYGFTLCFRETRDSAFLRQAEHIAGFILQHHNLPEDRIPFWDYDAPAIPNEPRDASAAAIAASALYELSQYSANGTEYRRQADRIMESLTKYYRAKSGSAHGFVLLHSTGHRPANSEVDVPIVYADYYFLEAALRMKKIREGKKLF